MAANFHNEPFIPTEPSEVYQSLAAALVQSGVTLTNQTTGESIALPIEIQSLLHEVFSALAQGQSVATTIPNHRLTTQEAAELLGISRPSFVKLLESGAIPFETTPSGKHRRVLLQDLIAYRRSERRNRREILDQMVRDAVAAGLYDLELPTDWLEKTKRSRIEESKDAEIDLQVS